MRLSHISLLGIIASLQIIPVASARFITLPSGVTADTYRHANRKKVVPKPVEYADWRFRNEQRQKDVAIIANALYLARKANDFAAPAGILLDEDKEICRMDATDCRGLVDLRESMKKFLPKIPIDPSSPKTSKGTGYVVHKNWKEQIYITAPLAEDGWRITKMH